MAWTFRSRVAKGSIRCLITIHMALCRYPTNLPERIACPSPLRAVGGNSRLFVLINLAIKYSSVLKKELGII
jgi:hypothetical protein